MSKKLPPGVRKANDAARFKRWAVNNRDKLRANLRRHYWRHHAEQIELGRKKWKERCMDRFRNSQYKRKYGITLADYNAMFEKQNGKCAICGSSAAGKVGQHFAVDHCHKTGKFRGLLCINCNGRLGWYEQHQSGIDEYVDTHIGRRVQFYGYTSPLAGDPAQGRGTKYGGILAPFVPEGRVDLITM